MIDYYDAKVTVLSEMIKHHVKEEEQRDGMFAKARAAGMDLQVLGEQLAARKAELMGEAEDEDEAPARGGRQARRGSDGVVTRLARKMRGGVTRALARRPDFFGVRPSRVASQAHHIFFVPQDVLLHHLPELPRRSPARFLASFIHSGNRLSRSPFLGSLDVRNGLYLCPALTYSRAANPDDDR